MILKCLNILLIEKFKKKKKISNLKVHIYSRVTTMVTYSIIVTNGANVL